MKREVPKFPFNGAINFFPNAILLQIVNFHESNSGSAIYSAHNRGVVAGWQVRDDRGFARVSRGMAAVLNILDLVLSDDPAYDRRLPVVIRGNQSSIAIV